MFKTRHALPGTPPATLTPLPPGEGSAPHLRVVEYGRDHYAERKPSSVAEFPAPDLGDGKVRWIEFNGLGDVEALRAMGEKYGLHPLALEDVVHTGQRPKADSYEGQLFIVAQMLYRDTEDGTLVGEQVSMFLLPGLLITIQEDPKRDVFDPIRERARIGGGYLRKLGPDYLAYTLLDAIIDQGFPILECIGEGLEELEERMLENPTKDCVAALHDHRRTLIHLRRAIWPERDLVNNLLHDESSLISDETKIFLRDAYDHAVRVMDLVESYRDLTASTLDLYLSSVSQRTNEIIRVLTVLSGIFIPLTFIAGVYGMNFENMPELRHPAGYFGCLGLMLTVTAGELWFFRRKGWI